MSAVFTVDPSFTALTVRREQVLVLVHSINAVSVKVPGIPTSPAMGYFVAWDVGRGSASAAIYLYYAEMQKVVAYLREPRVFAMTELPQVTDEATAFLESMGYMVDDAAYGTLRAEEQVAMLERVPVFHRDLGAFANARSAGSPAAESATNAAAPSAQPSERVLAVGRVLMSF